MSSSQLPVPSCQQDEKAGRTHGSAPTKSQAVVMLTLHRCSDRRLGPVIAVYGRTGIASRDLRNLGFTCRKVSGKAENGGPGHSVPHVWVVPLARWECDALLRSEVELLMARNNGSPANRLLELQRNLSVLRGEGRKP